MPVYAKRQAQVEALIFNKVSTKVAMEYSNYINVFLAENTAKLLENIEINEQSIKLEEGKQPLFGPIFSLGPVKLETLKTFIETNLANSFIQSSKFFARALIFFDRKSDKNLHFYINWGLNNITIKKQYLLPLIRKSLNWLGRVRQFT